MPEPISFSVTPLFTQLARRALPAVAALGMLAGCVSYRGIDPKAQPAEASGLAASQSLAQAAVANGQWPAAEWWKRLGDAELDQLVSEALAGSPNIRAAIAREDSALAAATVVGAQQGLGVTAGYDLTRQLLSQYGLVPQGFGGRWFTTNQLALNFQYQVDVWGRNQATLEASLGQAKAVEAEVQAARLSLSTAVVQAYIEMARNFEQADIARAVLKQREGLLSLAHDRLNAGLDSQIDVRQVEVSLPEARARIIQYEQAVEMGRNQLAALLGQGPDRGKRIARPQLAVSAMDTPLPSSLPADLLGRRPDIVAARWRIEATRRDIQSAKAAFYPNINLAGIVGLQSLVLSKFLSTQAEFTSFGPAVRLPLFGSGTLKGTLAARDADYDAAVERYNQLLADALREVVDQVDALRFTDQQGAELDRAMSLAEDSYRLAQARESGGLSGRLPVLSAEGQLLMRKSTLVDLRGLRLALNIGLVRALGGGYEPGNEQPPAPSAMSATNAAPVTSAAPATSAVR